jgi:DNA anti-recombination protein RmuC
MGGGLNQHLNANWTQTVIRDLERVNDCMVDQFSKLQDRLNSMSKNLAQTSTRVQRQQINQIKQKHKAAVAPVKGHPLPPQFGGY